MFDLKQLCEFLVQAKKSTYALGDDSIKIKESDGSTSLIFEKGDWKYHDNYFGGEPYGGREVVFFKNKPVYIMVYYGQIKNFSMGIEKIYHFLQESLRLIPEGRPFRGPEVYDQGSMRYLNIFSGEIDNFFGKETIELENEGEIYEARYVGGLVDCGK